MESSSTRIDAATTTGASPVVVGSLGIVVVGLVVVSEEEEACILVIISLKDDNVCRVLSEKESLQLVAAVFVVKEQNAKFKIETASSNSPNIENASSNSPNKH
jgi:hypothetical protein